MNWWLKSREGEQLISELEQDLLSRWAVKVNYNAQRASFRERGSRDEPAMPVSLKSWVLGTSSCPPDVQVVAAAIPLDDPVSELFGVYGSWGLPLPRRYVHVGPTALFVSWDHPQLPGSADQVAEKDRLKLPGTRIGRPVQKGDLTIPMMRDPEIVIRGVRLVPGLSEGLMRQLGT